MIRHEIVAQSQHWNDAVASLPNAHVLQTWEWGQIKSCFGWKPLYMLWRDESEKVVAAALVLERIIHLMGIETPMRVMYVPKGPILNWSDIELRQIVLSDLKTTAFDEGMAYAADTVNFTVTETGIGLEPPSRLGLRASPNPFCSSASISFELSEPGYTSIQVYDLSGRVICLLNNSELASGEYSIQWDGRSRNGEPVSAGLYFCRIQSGDIAETTGLCLLR